jgi:hypothetical protein
MTAVIVTLISALLFRPVGQERDPRGPLQPTALEAFVQQPDVRMVRSTEVGRIDAADTHAVVIAIIVEDAQAVPRQMKGLRINLSNPAAKDQIYLEEARLEPVKKALDEIERYRHRVLERPAVQGTRYLGAEEFWRPYERVHTLDAAYYILRDGSSGLSLRANKEKEEFRFPDHRPLELASILMRGIELLKDR